MKYEKEFIENLIENNKSQNTISAYVSDIKLLETYLSKGIELVTLKEIKDYINYLESESAKVQTINRRMASIKSYIKITSVFNTYNIDLSKLKKLQQSESFKDLLTFNETARMIKFAENEKDIRAVLIMKSLLLTGGRISEVLQLKVKDVGNNAITVKGKGGKYRQLLISKKLLKQIKEYLLVRKNNSDKLFTGQKGAINRQTVHTIIKKYAGKARIKLTKAHAHAFRHVYSQLLEDHGVKFSVIQQILGHTYKNVTLGYTQVGLSELIKTIDKINI
jgi:integrase/recombinase XerD